VPRQAVRGDGEYREIVKDRHAEWLQSEKFSDSSMKVTQLLGIAIRHKYTFYPAALILVIGARKKDGECPVR